MPSPLRTSLTTLVALLVLVPGVLTSCGPKGKAPAMPFVAGGSREIGPEAETDPDPLDLWERRVAEAIARVRESAVALEYTASDATGGARRVASGVVVGDGTEVLSVRIDAPSAATPIVTRVASGRRLPARWVAADPETGLTLLKIDPGFARPVAPSPRGARLGIPVLVIGNPFGLNHSVNRGYVAGLDRRLELGLRQLGGLIQVDAALHPGDSGALVADLYGGWIGVIRSGLAAPPEGDRRGREHDHDLGFAITAADALWVADQLRTRRRVDRAYLGVKMDRAAPAPPAGSEGAVLGLVVADSPAERAGLKTGDRVIAVDGHAVRSAFDLTDRLDRTPADAEVTLDLIRVGDNTPPPHPERVTLRSARRPAVEPSRPSRPKPASDAPRQALPREVTETIDRLERRIQDLEKRDTNESHSQR